MDLLDQAQQKNNEPQTTDIPDLSALMHPEIDTSLTESNSVTSVSPLPSTDVSADTTTQSFSSTPISIEPPHNDTDTNPPADPPPAPPAPDQVKKLTFHRSRGILIAAIALFLITLPVIGFFASNSSSLADLRGRAAGGSCQGSPPPGCTVSGFVIGGCGGRSQSNCNAVSACGCSWVEDTQPTQPPVQPTSGTQPTSPPGVTTCQAGSADQCQGVPFGGQITVSGICMVCVRQAENKCGRQFCDPNLNQCQGTCFDGSQTCNARGLNAASGVCSGTQFCCGGPLPTSVNPTNRPPNTPTSSPTTRPTVVPTSGPTATPGSTFPCPGVNAQCSPIGGICIGTLAAPYSGCLSGYVCCPNNYLTPTQTQCIQDGIGLSFGQPTSTCCSNTSHVRSVNGVNVTFCGAATCVQDGLALSFGQPTSTCCSNTSHVRSVNGQNVNFCGPSTSTAVCFGGTCYSATASQAPGSNYERVNDPSCQPYQGIQGRWCPRATPTLAGGACKTTGNSASACNGRSAGTDVGPCTCRYSSLGAQDCACIPDATPIPTGPGGNCSALGQSCESQGCCTANGLVCQGVSGSRICQQSDPNDCPGLCGRLIAFHCNGWFASECKDNPIYINNNDMAAALAHVNGCGQVDQVCSSGANQNNLCGDFNIVKTNCGNNPTNPPTTPNQPTNTPVLAQCQNIKIYRNNTLLLSTQYNSIKPGDQLVLATVATGTTTKARYTINNGTPQETTLKNNQGEYILNYTVPVVTVATQFRIQAEIFADNVWK